MGLSQSKGPRANDHVAGQKGSARSLRMRQREEGRYAEESEEKLSRYCGAVTVGLALGVGLIGVEG